MTGPAADTAAALPPDTGLRVGTVAVDSNGAITVTVQGAVVDCGYLNPYDWTEGQPVALTRYRGTWLALGTISAAAVPSRIATTVALADSATFTANTILMSVSGWLIAGRTYRVRGMGHIASSVAADVATARIRPDTVGSADIQIQADLTIPNTGAAGTLFDMEAEYTPTVDELKTFHFVGVRAAGTGNLRLSAGGTRPGYLYIDYIRGA